MTHLLIFMLCLPAFAALAMATDRAQDDVLGHALPAAITRNLRIVGWALLVAALWAAVATMGWALGLVAYSGHTSAAAAAVFIILLLRNRRRAR
ncbi:DUF3325 family protein [Ottowia thiooxydans]|uniref:DUF3325 family protein n=1 Tax=Ottowia thiooxydans TaxID=219182 RepID=UPI0003F95C4B|nr:DUF3325 family protein [Ottowia thiooxydans]